MKKLLAWRRSARTPRHESTGSHRVLREAWLRKTHSERPAADSIQSSLPAARDFDFVELDRELKGHIEAGDPGRNAFIRSRYVREDTGTHETLKIIDESVLASSRENGSNPYDNGHFDRPTTWGKRIRG